MRTRLLLTGVFGPGHLAVSYARAFEAHGIGVFRFDADREYVEASRFPGNRYFRRAFRFWLWHMINRSTIAVARTVKWRRVAGWRGRPP